MIENLVIVESPAKCKTINKYLGKDYKVLASFGHIRDLPSKDGSVDTENGFILSTTLSPASHNDSIYFPRAVIFSAHTEDRIKIAYADKGYPGAPNREFLALNKIKDGIMRKDTKNTKLTDFEIERNKGISKYRYIVEQYFGISHKYDNGKQARFPKILKNKIDIMFRQFAFNLKKGTKILKVYPI